MATKYWRGGAPAVAGVKTATPGSVSTSDTFTITFPNGRSFTYTATGSTVAEVTAGLVALLQASSDPLVTELTYEDDTTHITITGPADGKPFDLTCSSSGGTLSEANVTSATGPNWWTEPDNWDTGTIPTDADTAICESDVPILYGLATSISESDAHLVVGGNQVIGLPENDPLGYSNLDYRPTFLEGEFTTVTIRTTGGRCKVDTIAAVATVRIYATGSPIDQGQRAVELRGGDLNVVDIAGGNVGIGTIRDPNNTGGSAVANAATVRVTNGPDEQADVHIGPIATCTTLNQAGGAVMSDVALTTVNKAAGELTIRGTATVTTLNNDGGIVYYDSSGTITTYRGGNRQVVEATEEAVLDLSRDHRALTITNAVFGPERWRLIDPGSRRTHSNAATIGMGDVTIMEGGRAA